jgi:hypothetical protein
MALHQVPGVLGHRSVVVGGSRDMTTTIPPPNSRVGVIGSATHSSPGAEEVGVERTATPPNSSSSRGHTPTLNREGTMEVVEGEGDTLSSRGAQAARAGVVTIRRVQVVPHHPRHVMQHMEEGAGRGHVGAAAARLTRHPNNSSSSRGRPTPMERGASLATAAAKGAAGGHIVASSMHSMPAHVAAAARAVTLSHPHSSSSRGQLVGQCLTLRLQGWACRVAGRLLLQLLLL